MTYTFSNISEEDRKPVIDIFNYYIENSFAAYLEKKVAYDFFDIFLTLFKGYPSIKAKDSDGRLVGFSFLRAHHPASTFMQTAEVTYFILPDHTRKGIGRYMLDQISKDAKQNKISNLLANISSLNPASIAFHQKSGFVECGRFRNTGRKNGTLFDVIWMQKIL